MERERGRDRKGEKEEGEDINAPQGFAVLQRFLVRIRKHFPIVRGEKERDWGRYYVDEGKNQRGKKRKKEAK